MARQEYDFTGWATRNDIKCSDGRIIRHNAFADNDGKRVPLVWNHNHNDIDNVLGHVILKNDENGVRAYGFFNPTDKGRNAKTILEHGDITSLSIYANKLKQVGGDVIHGDIKEVSLVLAGANPGAYIDEIRHGEDSVLDAIILSTGEEVFIEHGEIDDNDYHDDETTFTSKEVEIESLEHADEDKDMTIRDVIDSMTEKQRNVLFALVGMAAEGGDIEEMSHAEAEDDEDMEDDNGETIQDVIDTMTEAQKNVLYALVGMAAEDAESEVQHAETEMEDEEEMAAEEKTVQDVIDEMTDEQRNVLYTLIGMASEEAQGADEEDYDEGDEDMKHNFFADEDDYGYEDALIHSEVLEALDDARRIGTVQGALEAHGLNKEDVLVHGVEHVDYLFPEYANVNGNQVPFVNINPNAWVNVVNNGVHKTAFAKVKMIFADLTADEARAKGYVKGNVKLDEVISLLKREVDPTTIYKKQKMDRDDILDIADNIDVIAMIKEEMKIKWDEEKARAILFGDGRSVSDPAKINESKIIPVLKDTQDNFYAMLKTVTPEQNETLPHAIINTVVSAMDEYEGSGNITAFMSSEVVTSMILMEDKFGHRLYKNLDELASAMLVDKIVKVPTSVVPEGFYGVALDLTDYNVGANKGGERSLFDDFDIDYNKMVYLLEGRCSGALVKPHSAIVLKASE